MLCVDIVLKMKLFVMLFCFAVAVAIAIAIPLDSRTNDYMLPMRDGGNDFAVLDHYLIISIAD